MSLATFKKKSINSASTATKISGKPSSQYWIYASPYGKRGNLSSTIFLRAIMGPDGVTNQYDTSNAHNAGFSINGPYVNIGRVGQEMKMSKSNTPFKGIYPKGWGGKFGKYPDGPDNFMLNYYPGLTKPGTSGAYVRPSVLSTKGMLARKYRWIKGGQYPNYWVQPIYTGFQTETASQGMYIHDKAAANFCNYDVNDTQNYVDYFKSYGPMGCQTTPARGYTFAIQQANAPYTKTLHRPKSASEYTVFIQQKCQNQVGLQKPYPYAVQTGTGVLRGGTDVYQVASSCNTSNTNTTPPDWYTGAKLTPDGKRITLRDQLLAIQKKVIPEIQRKVFYDVFLNSTSNPST
jgi:hypothetical protein